MASPAPHLELTETEQKTLQALLKHRQTAQGAEAVIQRLFIETHARDAPIVKQIRHSLPSIRLEILFAHCARTRKNAALPGTVNWNLSLPCPSMLVCGVVRGKGVK